MDIQDVNIHNINDLTEAELKQVKRQGMRNFASFVMIKVFIMILIGALSKVLLRRAEMKN